MGKIERKLKFFALSCSAMNEAVKKFSELFGLDSEEIMYIDEFLFGVSDIESIMHNNIVTIKNAKFYIVMNYVKNNGERGNVYKELRNIDEFTNYFNKIFFIVSGEMERIKEAKRIAIADLYGKVDFFVTYIAKITDETGIEFE